MAMTKLRPAEKFKPIDPGERLAPYQVPALKAFDRHLPGQGAFDFDSDDPGAVVYDEDETSDV
jgi:hypothetical protein